MMSKWLYWVLFSVFVGSSCCLTDAHAADATAYTLPNGLHVIVQERHASPLVAIALWVRAGAREERANEIGSAHFLEHTLFKGTTTRRAGDADIAIENLGAVLDAATGPDYAQFYTTVSSIHLAASLSIMADVVRNATLPAVEIEHERGVILDELAQHDADPVAHLVDLLYADGLPNSVYGRSPGGTPATIGERQQETLAAFYRRCYVPSRCTLVLVGDCTPEQGRAEAQRALGDWGVAGGTIAPALPATSTPAFVPSAVAEIAPGHIEARAPATYGMVGMALLAPAAEDKRMACAGMLVAALLGDARGGGRLAAPSFADTEAAVRYTPRQDTGLLLITARVPERNRSAPRTEVPALETTLTKALRDLQTNLPGTDEINSARRLLLGRLQFDTETNAGLARALGYAAIVGGDVPDVVRARIRQVTRADIAEYCRRFLNPDRSLTIRLLPTTDVTRILPNSPRPNSAWQRSSSASLKSAVALRPLAPFAPLPPKLGGLGGRKEAGGRRARRRAYCKADPMPTVQRITLPDGARLVLKPEPTTDVTAITLFIQTPRDPAGQTTATADMVAHALFYSSTDRTRDGIALSVAEVGGVLETLRTPDYVAVTVVTMPERIEETARMLGEALKHADFTPDALELGLHDILASRKQRHANGFDLGTDALRSAFMATDAPGEDQLRRVTQGQAQSYFATRYVPARTVVSVVGRFAVRDVETAFRAYFADYDRPATSLPAARQSDPINSSNPPAELTLPSGTPGYALVGVDAPSVDSPDAPAFAALHALLGGGHASRLFRRVRDTLGVGYDVGASLRTDLADPLIAYLQWDTQRAGAGGTALSAAEALRRINAQLDGVLTDPPDDAEVERARNVAIGRDALRHERARDRAFLLGWYETVGLGYGYDADYPQRLAVVTRADVLRVAAKYLPQRAAVTILPNRD
jgi:zinc protease